MLKSLLLMTLVTIAILGTACGTSRSRKAGRTPAETDNPLLSGITGKFGVPPFAEIRQEHYIPAFDVALVENQEEVNRIAVAPEAPTFENTIAALDYSGERLRYVSNIFFNKNSADTNDEIQKLAQDIAPRLSAHSDGILMNAKLFARIKAVYDRRASEHFSEEQMRLLEQTYKQFVRGGALLDDAQKARVTEINQRLTTLELTFGEHLLAENNTFKMFLDKPEDLAGLPQDLVQAAAEGASEAGQSGKWLFTLHKPSWMPFITYSQRRDLRQKMVEAYNRRGNHSDERDNKDILRQMVSLRIERAHLLGYESHAAYVLEDSMAQTPRSVEELLGRLWSSALPMTQREAESLQAMLAADGVKDSLQPWDWWYYAEKLRKQKYDLSEEALRPYFSLKNVQQGAFDVATKLFGLKFAPLADMPVYHEDVEAYNVLEADGTHVGVLYVDYFPRASKRQGAWMTEYVGDQVKNGKRVDPVVANVFNFTRPTEGKPALLTLEEVQTLFHEFGHGLHGLLSHVSFPSLAGTNVPRDFVELPSQFMENWATEPAVLGAFARHYETGQTMPQSLMDKIHKARHFNQGFATTEYLAASVLDLRWHELTQEPGKVDVVKFENNAMNELGLVPQIEPRYRSTFFSHVFGGGYSAGYYSYIWSAVLDADAFQAFKDQPELFDQKTAQSYRKNILEKGGSADPAELYRRFRGKDPSIEPLLERRGLKQAMPQ
ncbi:MAG: M3 family metallopeptidase [Myxococcota bacterium]|nr:M3 family metallopeptidase [Myxococcota bacterium]